jgi:hypothetical protein
MYWGQYTLTLYIHVEEVFMNNEAVDLMINSLYNTCVVRREKRSVLII